MPPGTRTVKVKLDGDISGFNRAMLGGVAGAKAFSNSLDTSTDRMGNLVQMSLALGPALVPIGAAAIPAISGLTNQLAFAAAGAGVMAVAFQGIGTALKAVNQYQLEPTTANLEKMRESLATLGPDGQKFVQFLQELRPEMQQLQNAAQAGFFPGAKGGLTDIMHLLPQAERIVSTIATSIGDLIAEAGDNLDSPKWEEFFTFLETEARPTLMDMGRTLGNFTAGFAHLWMAFSPVSNDFSKSFLRMSRDFSEWTDGLDETQGFEDFLDFIERVGPKVWDTLGAVGDALLQIVEAAAPVGEATLPAITALSKVIATLADSNLGPVVIGIVSLTSALSRMKALALTANSSSIGGLFGKSGYGGLGATLKGATKATAALTLAQDKLAVSSLAARDAQFALIPAAGKRKAIAAYSADVRGVAAAEAAATSASRARLAQMGKLAAGAAGLAFVVSDLDDKMGLSNTATLALMGSLAGPWGAALGGAVGLTMDLAAANDTVGHSFDRVQDALRLGTDGYDKQVAALDRAKKAMDDFKRDRNDDGNFWQQGFGNVFDDTKNFFEGVLGSSQVEENSAKYKKLADSVQGSLVAKNEEALASVGLDASLYNTTRTLNDQTLAVLSNIDAHNKRSDQELSTIDKEMAWEASIDAATDALKRNGRTLDTGTPKGRENVKATQDMVRAWNDLPPAEQVAAGAYKKHRDQIVKTRMAFGDTKAAAEAYADAAMAIPPDIATQIELLGKDAAAADIAALLDTYGLARKDVVAKLKAANLTKPQIAAVLAALDNLDRQRANPLIDVRDNASNRLRQIGTLIRDLHGKTIGIKVVGGTQLASAGGNIMEYYAGGGLRENHIAQIAPAGSQRVWNEPETKGEAYIPLANDWRRPRARAILAETASLIGMRAFAAGGFNNSQSSSAPIALDGLSGQLTITNWETGEGRFQLIADDAASRALSQAQRSAAGSRSTRGVNR